jgi:hypothetical protein
MTGQSKAKNTIRLTAIERRRSRSAVSGLLAEPELVWRR